MDSKVASLETGDFLIPALKSRQTEAKNVAIPQFEQQKGGQYGQ